MTITKIEKEILRGPIKKVIKENKRWWKELKQEIFDYGYQSNYMLQVEFEKSAKIAILSLDQVLKEQLISEWKRIPRLIFLESDEEILKQYGLVVVEAIVERARKAKS
ncbi:MAG: hypothetical protein WC732_02940 [Candidatus Omnitrophota bacterium]